MTPEQEDFALRSCHPRYREMCEEDEEQKIEDEATHADFLYDSWRDDQLREE